MSGHAAERDAHPWPCEASLDGPRCICPAPSAEKGLPDPLLAVVTAAIHLRRHPAHPHHCRCEEFAQAALGAIRGAPESVEVVRGWRYYNDGSASPIERWVRHADGDWVSLDSTRRTSGDIHVIPPAKGQDR